MKAILLAALVAAIPAPPDAATLQQRTVERACASVHDTAVRGWTILSLGDLDGSRAVYDVTLRCKSGLYRARWERVR